MYGAAAQSIFQSRLLVLYTLLKSVRGHATRMSFLLQWSHRSDSPNCFLALASAELLGVGRQGNFSSLSFPDVTVTIGFWPSGYFRRYPPFVDPFRNFHVLENCTGLPVGLQLKSQPCR